MAQLQQKLALALVTSLTGLGFIEVNRVDAASLRLGIDENLKNYYVVSRKDSQKNSPVTTETQTIKRRASTAEEINENIEERYQDLIEEDTEKISLLESNKIAEKLLTEIAPEQTITETDFNGVSIANELQEGQAKEYIPKSLLYSLIALIGIWAIPTINFVGKSYVWGEEGFVENLKNKYGKPKVPEGSVFLHNRSFKELETLGKQAERVDDKKFGNEEFILFVKVKQAINEDKKEYKQLAYSGELLRVAIAAQSSFLKIEQTELRFRSRKQQEFYDFVADSLIEETNKDKFKDKVKRKLAEIIPLLNSDEGRHALQAYLREIDLISQHEIGLKLLALFKKYQLADYTILKRVSDIVDLLEGKDLLEPKNLVILVIENYEVFEKLDPIIGINEVESTPEIYANILHYIGLNSRYKDSYSQFEKLIKILKKWQKPYQSVMAIREEYKENKYRIPPEFSQTIPGLNVYHKYEKYLSLI
jgi:hypothetical protein